VMSGIARWRWRSAWLWMIGRCLAAFAIVWVGRRLASRRESSAIEEFGYAIAPLVLFALFWLLADSPPTPNTWTRLT
jgi:hypothetical protein